MSHPTKIRVARDRRSMEVAFADGRTYTYSAEALRVLSPSAEVQGHHPGQRVTVPGKRNVEIMQMEPVGNYAVRITFDDMHNTGIYSWDFLLELGAAYEERFSDYLQELEAKGLTRDKPAAPR